VDQFDRAVQRLGIAMEGQIMYVVAFRYRDLAAVMHKIADLLLVVMPNGVGVSWPGHTRTATAVETELGHQPRPWGAQRTHGRRSSSSYSFCWPGRSAQAGIDAGGGQRSTGTPGRPPHSTGSWWLLRASARSSWWRWSRCFRWTGA
jgi:hypothetical protein